MAGLVPAIPTRRSTAMDGRDKPGHDAFYVVHNDDESRQCPTFHTAS